MSERVVPVNPHFFFGVRKPTPCKAGMIKRLKEAPNIDNVIMLLSDGGEKISGNPGLNLKKEKKAACR